MNKAPFRLIAVVLIGLSTACSGDPPTLVPGTIQASDLYSAYADNELAAQAKYEGNGVTISGEISDIGRDLLGDPYVAFRSEGALFGVQAMFTKGTDDARVAAYSKGQAVTLTCLVSGKLGNVVLRQCK